MPDDPTRANPDIKRAETNPSTSHRKYDQISVVVTIAVECSREYSGTVYIPFTHTFTISCESVEYAVQSANYLLGRVMEATKTPESNPPRDK